MVVICICTASVVKNLPPIKLRKFLTFKRVSIGGEELLIKFQCKSSVTFFILPHIFKQWKNIYNTCQLKNGPKMIVRVKSLCLRANRLFRMLNYWLFYSLPERRMNRLFNYRNAYYLLIKII